jgi:hypothetical protein
VKRLIDELDDERSVVLLVANYTDHVFEVVADHHDHGGFAVNPTGEIPGQYTDTYGSKDTGWFTGTKGAVTYKAKDADFYVRITWDNPFIGGNSCTAWCYRLAEAPPEWQPLLRRIPVEASDVDVSHHSCGGGNRLAEMRYEIRPPE